MANEFIARNGVIAQNNSTVTGSLNVTGGITGSLFGTASWAVSASWAPSVPGGGNAEIQFNKSGSFEGAKYFRYISSSRSLIQGTNSTSNGLYSFTHGDNASAPGDYSYSQGNSTQAIGNHSHAEGDSTRAIGVASHAEGLSTYALGDYSHAEGDSTRAIGVASHAEGTSTEAIGVASHAEGSGPKTGGQNGYLAISVVSGLVTLSGSYGDITVDYSAGNYLYINDLDYDGLLPIGSFVIDSATFNGTETEILLVDTSVTTTTAVVGNLNLNAFNWAGDQTYRGDYSHAEGANTRAMGSYSHAEGEVVQAVGGASHAQGYATIAIGQYSHAEGEGTLAIGNASHAEGQSTIALGDYSHAEGQYTIASGSHQHVSGRYNTHGDDTSLFIIGNGVDDANRSDVFRVSGSIVQIIGSLTVTGSQVWIYTDNYATYINGIDLLAIDTNGARFNDLSGNSSVSAENRTLYNNSGQPSVDWNNRQLYDSSGATVVVDWNQNILSDNTAGAASIDWEQRQLIKSDGSTIGFDWENGQITGSLNVSGSQTNFTTDDFVVNVNGVNIITVNPSTTQLTDETGTGGVELSSVNRLLLDNVAGSSVDWQNRQLIKSDGTTIAFDWENGILTGSLYGTSSWSENSISSSYALTASYVAGASSFPYTGSAQITGSLGVTGSVVATSFSGDGSGLTGITATNVSSKLFNYYNFT